MTIALDIDGTVTKKNFMIPDTVANYLKDLSQSGWQIAFITGRTFSFANMTLKKLDFPFLLGLQNGADLIEMPSKKRVHHSYLSVEIIPFIEDLYKGFENDFLVYSGFEKGDFCYFRPNRFSPKMMPYLKTLERLSSKPWKVLKTFKDIQQDSFPLVKCLGIKDMLIEFDEKLSSIKDLKTTIINDPFSPELHISLITHQNADKGKAAIKFMDTYNLKRPLITAGDDNNDIPLLKIGDINIAMDGAPEALLKLANIIAPSSESMGIIEGLKKAIKLV